MNSFAYAQLKKGTRKGEGTFRARNFRVFERRYSYTLNCVFVLSLVFLFFNKLRSPENKSTKQIDNAVTLEGFERPFIKWQITLWSDHFIEASGRHFRFPRHAQHFFSFVASLPFLSCCHHNKLCSFFKYVFEYCASFGERGEKRERHCQYSYYYKKKSSSRYQLEKITLILHLQSRHA